MRRPIPDPVGPGQESVWDYPRPPAVEPVDRRVVIEFAGETIVDTRDVVRVLETSHPPVYYLPRAAFAPGTLADASGSSWCEFKGRAAYFDVVVGERVAGGVAWTYPEPSPGYGLLRDRVALYAAPMDRVTLDGEVVVPQPGGFYGGWVTAEIVGPFKGGPGSAGW
ncbi:DUF427 domain-containing protein [Microbacterium sp. CJ88]|uniref:DUF427 domain-containing protein n=1 Tax=Microbacterium sp. CJ88 TaxID=3445672 RepID=UPI003F65772C